MLENRYAWLIQLFETGENITHADAVLQNRQAWFDALVNENALAHSGNVSCLLCPQCDEPHDIAVDPFTFKGYCVDAGHVSFEPKRIMQYQASHAWLIEAVRKSLSVSASDNTKELGANHFWKIGSVRLGGKPRPLFLCRDVGQSIKAVTDSLKNPPEDPGVILLTSPHRNCPGAIAGHRVALLSLCLPETGKNFLSHEVLERIWKGQPAADNQLSYSADFRTVTLNGITHHFPGDLMRAFVKHLIELYKKGQLSTKTSEVMTAIGADHSRRIGDLFKGHKTWETLIECGGKKGSSSDLIRGTCRLRIN